MRIPGGSVFQDVFPLRSPCNSALLASSPQEDMVTPILHSTEKITGLDDLLGLFQVQPL